MSRLPTLSPLALQCKSGSIQSSNAPLVNRPVVEVSEDSSCDDVDHDCRINNSDDTKKRRRMTTTTRKQRKARRNSTPSLNRRTAEISQSCHSLPSKIHPSQSYPGPKNSDMHCCNYRSSECEYSLDGTSTTNESITIASVTSRGVTCPFPWKLHDMLKYCCPQNGLESSSEPPIVIWNSTGTAFAVLDVNRFVQAILPRFFAQSKYASFQRQLNLYGFTRTSVPCNQRGKTKNISYYSHPYFIRGDLSLVQNMVRCKIKGTGKKHWCTNDDDDKSSGEYCNKNPTESLCKDILANRGGETKNCVSMPEEWVDDFDNPAIDSKNAPLELRDGDLLFFDGIPFHFLNTKLDDAIQNDLSVQDSDVDSLSFMLPLTFPVLQSDVDLVQVEDELKRNHAISYGVVPQDSRSIILDEKFSSYRNVSVSRENSISAVEIVCPQQSDATILGVFDHHFYDIHSPGTPAVPRHKNCEPSKHRSPNPADMPLLNTWSKFHHPKAHMTAI